MCEMFGGSSSGKTALATAWMIQAQKLGGVAGFIDWERSFNEDMAVSLGLNNKRPFWVYNKARTWEEGNIVATRAATLIRKADVIDPKAPILFVFDSIASATPQSVVFDAKGKEREIDTLSMNDNTALARVTSTTLKTQAYFCEDTNATFLYLNQIRTKPGVAYGDPTTTPGGSAMEFYSTGRLSISRQKIMEEVGGEKVMTGQLIKLKCVKSKMTAPFRECSLRMSFDELGMAKFDITLSSIEALIEDGLLETAGAYVVWEGKKYHKAVLAKKIDAEGLQAELRKLFVDKA